MGNNKNLFSDDQLATLQAAFAANPKPAKFVYSSLASLLNLRENQVYQWFYRRRQSKLPPTHSDAAPGFLGASLAAPYAAQTRPAPHCASTVVAMPQPQIAVDPTIAFTPTPPVIAGSAVPGLSFTCYACLESKDVNAFDPAQMALQRPRCHMCLTSNAPFHAGSVTQAEFAFCYGTSPGMGCGWKPQSNFGEARALTVDGRLARPVCLACDGLAMQAHAQKGNERKVQEALKVTQATSTVTFDSFDTGKQRVLDFFRSSCRDGVGVERVQISMRCPFSQRLMTLACRGTMCTHLDACDLSTFLQVQYSAKHPTWKCPHCRGILSLESLRVDKWLNKAIRNAPDYATEIVIESNAKYSFVSPVGVEGSASESEEQESQLHPSMSGQSSGVQRIYGAVPVHGVVPATPGALSGNVRLAPPPPNYGKVPVLARPPPHAQGFGLVPELAREHELMVSDPSLSRLLEHAPASDTASVCATTSDPRLLLPSPSAPSTGLSEPSCTQSDASFGERKALSDCAASTDHAFEG